MQQLWSILDITFCVVGLHAAWQNTEHVACCSLHQIYFVLLCMTCPQVILLVYLCFYVDCRQTCKLSYKPCIKCPEVQLLKSKRLQFARSCSHYADVTCFDTAYAGSMNKVPSSMSTQMRLSYKWASFQSAPCSTWCSYMSLYCCWYLHQSM